MAESSKDWRFIPAKESKANGLEWTQPNFHDAAWQNGKSPIGYGEEEIRTRMGTEITEKGQDFLFRRAIEIPAELLQQKDVVFRLSIASDNNATVYLNGSLLDQDPEGDHEFSYWNREVEIPLKQLKPGPNLFAFRVKNTENSSDLFLDAEVTAQIPLPKKNKNPNPITVVTNPNDPRPKTDVTAKEEPRDPTAIRVDKATRTITVRAAVAPRKLPQYDQTYPIEVIATLPAPRGQKAHETVLVFTGLRPSDVHKALIDLGAKPGKPAYGENARASGTEVKLYLEWTVDGKAKRVVLDECLVQRDGSKPTPKMTWYFTGSVMKQPDPEKDDQVYGADLTGTLISIFPVTDCTVFQSQLTMKEEAMMKLETNQQLLPKEGTEVRLIIQLP